MGRTPPESVVHPPLFPLEPRQTDEEPEDRWGDCRDEWWDGWGELKSPFLLSYGDLLISSSKWLFTLMENTTQTQTFPLNKYCTNIKQNMLYVSVDSTPKGFLEWHIDDLSKKEASYFYTTSSLSMSGPKSRSPATAGDSRLCVAHPATFK